MVCNLHHQKNSYTERAPSGKCRDIMPVRVVFCGLCTPKQSDIYELLQQLRTNRDADVEVMELECMAACDETPAVMIGHHYYPQMTANALRHLLNLGSDTTQRER